VRDISFFHFNLKHNLYILLQVFFFKKRRILVRTRDGKEAEEKEGEENKIRR